MPAEGRPLPFLNVLVSLVVMIAALYWAKAVVIPVALAILLTFLLTPIVNALWRHGLGRALAAVVVVVLVFGLVGAIGWTIAAQISTFAAKLPTYTDNLKQKIAQVQHAGTEGALGKVQKAVEDVISAFQQRLPSTSGSATPVAGQTEGPLVLSYLPSLVDECLKTQTLVEVYDTVLVPALSYAKQDRGRDILTMDEVQSIVQATQEIVEDLGTRPPTPEVSAVLGDGTPTAPLTKACIVGCPARDETDALALQTRYEVELLPVALPIADVVARVAQTPRRSSVSGRSRLGAWPARGISASSCTPASPIAPSWWSTGGR